MGGSKHVAVLLGGGSSEREVSLRSGKACADALERRGYRVTRIDVKRDMVVKNGQVVGLAGATGRVTGPHLHWGTRVQGARVDPFTLVSVMAAGK